MSVATKNPFALLDAEDPSRPSTPASAPANEAAVAQPSTAPTRGNNQRGRGPASRGGKYYQRGGAKPGAAPRENEAEDSPAASGGEKPKRTFDGEGRGGRGRGRGRGGVEHRGGDRHGGGGDRGDRGDRPPREGGGRGYRGNREPRPDRHSQTGKTDSDKKVHQSWGGDDGPAEQKVEAAAERDAAAETNNAWGVDPAAEDPWSTAVPTTSDEPVMPPSATAEGGAGEGRKGGRGDREQEEEDNTLTLEQYLAQKAEKEVSLLPKLETRKANEGTDDSLWKDAIKMTKGEESDAYFVGKTKSAPKARAPKPEKVFIEIEPRFSRPDRGRGRGERGGDRSPRTPRGNRSGYGGGGRSNGRQPPTPVVNVDDKRTFPSLS